jgi:hypothetical protein
MSLNLKYYQAIDQTISNASPLVIIHLTKAKPIGLQKKEMSFW